MSICESHHFTLLIFFWRGLPKLCNSGKIISTIFLQGHLLSFTIQRSDRGSNECLFTLEIVPESHVQVSLVVWHISLCSSPIIQETHSIFDNFSEKLQHMSLVKPSKWCKSMFLLLKRNFQHQCSHWPVDQFNSISQAMFWPFNWAKMWPWNFALLVASPCSFNPLSLGFSWKQREAEEFAGKLWWQELHSYVLHPLRLENEAYKYMDQKNEKWVSNF